MTAPTRNKVKTTSRYRRAKQLLRDWYADLVGYRKPLVRLLLLSLLVLAPFISVRTAYVVIAIGLWLLAVASRFAFVIVCLLLIAPAILQQHLSRHWGLGQLDARFEAMLESPPNEIHEYLQTHADLLDIAFLIAAVVYIVMLFRWMKQSGNAPRSLRRLAVVAVVVVPIAFEALWPDRTPKQFLPYKMYEQAVRAQHRFRQLSMRNRFLAQNPLPARKCELRYQKIVVVFGESAVSDHMSIFGYPKQTTPFADRSDPHAFDTLAPSNQTRFSLGMMLTPAAPGSFDSFYESHSLIGELRQCGLHTLWISNQGRRGQYDSFITSIALEADEQVFLNEWSWTDSKLDGRVVEELTARGAYEMRGRATFIHLIGSHTDYKKRIPTGFGFSDASSVVANYDNTILYTDQILSELYSRFADEALLFVYVSDHGQVVSEDRYGSGFMPGRKAEYRTPLLIWTDDAASIGKLRTAIGEARLNLESFDDVMRYLVGLSPTPKISTRQTVSVLTPDHVTDYADLMSTAVK